ncbi:MAG: CARDB domain-containing protein, partial [bacterium]
MKLWKWLAPFLFAGTALGCGGAGIVITGPIDLVLESLGMPTLGVRGLAIQVRSGVHNQGVGTAGAFVVKFYLSTNTTVDAGDGVIGQRTFSSLNPPNVSEAVSSHAIPSNQPAGTYYLIAVVDANSQVDETDETNNTRVSAGTIQVRAMTV